MRFLIIFGFAIFALQQCSAPPVVTQKPSTEENIPESERQANVHYHRYLGQVLEVLEGNKEFRAKLENASEDAIRSGAIAEELQHLHPDLRSQLDEIKRNEVERLRHLAMQQYEQEKGLDPTHMKIHEHLDVKNPHTFEIKDLKKLILKTTADLSKVDQERREEFKTYEMKKKFEIEEKKKHMKEEEKKNYTAELKALEEKHKKHKPLHHPGSKQQLEEVWEKQDHMEDQDFDARTFFSFHDVDGNGAWDPIEVNALFVKELDKIYEQGGPDTDVRERVEEMERMREHVFREADENKDGLISYAEFLKQSKSAEFEKDEGWKTLDEQQIYTDEDYEKFERQQREEMERRIAAGISPSGHGSYDPGHHQQFAPQHVGSHQDFVQPMGDRHPAMQQQHFQGQIPHHEQQFQGQIPQHQQQIQGQIPQHQQQFQGQIPHHQQQFQGQIPQQHQQQFQGQIPQQHLQAEQQVPHHQQNIAQHQGYQQVPQYQVHPEHGQVQAQNELHHEQIPQVSQQGHIAQPSQVQPNIPVQNQQQVHVSQQTGNSASPVHQDAQVSQSAPSQNAIHA